MFEENFCCATSKLNPAELNLRHAELKNVEETAGPMFSAEDKCLARTTSKDRKDMETVQYSPI